MFGKVSITCVVWLLISGLPSCWAESDSLDAVVVAVESITFERDLGDKRDNLCADPDEFSDTKSRVLMELTIICLALREAGFVGVVYGKPVPNYARALSSVKDGKVHTMAESIWSGDIDYKHVYKTKDVIRRNEFEKGIYTRINHPLRDAEVTIDSLAKYIGITQPTWHYDWQVLNKLTPKVVPAHSTFSLVKMIREGRADFTILEFPSNNDLAIKYHGGRLYVVKGVKIVLPDSRAFVISKAADQAKSVYSMIDAGIEKLRKKGEIHRLYRKIGFFNESVSDWTVLNVQDVST